MTKELETVLDALKPIQEKISKSESESILDRWEFGNLLVAKRGDKKQLPNGMRADIADHFNLEASEITRRMQLAEKFKTHEQVMDACNKYGGAWRRLIREELVKRREAEKRSPWGALAQARVDRLVKESGESDGRHDELVVLLKAALRTLTDVEVEK